MAAGSASAMALASDRSATVLEWGWFSEAPNNGQQYPTTKVTISEIQLREDVGSTRYWTAEKVATDLSGTSATQWADSRTCPALTRAMAELARLEPIRIAPPSALSSAARVVLDGGAYEIAGVGLYPKEGARGAFRLTGTSDSPIAAWVRQTLSAVAPCWSATRPPLFGARSG